MRLLNLPLLGMISLVLVACGSAGGMDGGQGGNEPPAPLPGVYVDRATGSDTTGTGEFDKPFKSITRALQLAQAGDVVRVAAGTYDAANGEVFPIIPPVGVEVRGTVRRSPIFGTVRLTKLVGGGFWLGDPRRNGTILPTPDSRFVDLAIKNPTPASPIGTIQPAAVLMLMPFAVTVESVSVFESMVGVHFDEGVSEAHLKDSVIADNATGILITNAGSGNRVTGTKVLENSFGVYVRDTGVALHGSGDGSFPGNAFAGNLPHDVVLDAGTNPIFFLENNFWDHVPPTEAPGIVPADPTADIRIVGGGVFTTGARLYVPDAPLAPPLQPVVGP
jgi:hypothetical protein